MRSSSQSPTLRSRFDYYYSSMSPGSSAAQFYDNNIQSLFGDPVPPSTDFLQNLDNHLYGSFRQSNPKQEETTSTDNRYNDRNGKMIPETKIILDTTYHHQNNGTYHPTTSLFIDNRRKSSSAYSDDVQITLQNVRSSNEVLPPIPPKRVHSSQTFLPRPLATHTTSIQQMPPISMTNYSEWRTKENWNNRPQTTFSNHNNMNDDENENKDNSAMIAIIQDSTSSSKEESSPEYRKIGQSPIHQLGNNRLGSSKIIDNSSYLSIKSPLQRLPPPPILPPAPPLTQSSILKPFTEIQYNTNQRISSGLQSKLSLNSSTTRDPVTGHNIKSQNFKAYQHVQPYIESIHSSSESGNENNFLKLSYHSPSESISSRRSSITRLDQVNKTITVDKSFIPKLVQKDQNKSPESENFTPIQNPILTPIADRIKIFENYEKSKDVRKIKLEPQHNNNNDIGMTSRFSTSNIHRSDSKESDSVAESENTSILTKRSLSPAIIRDTVSIGSANRLNPSRQHKKTSFAIINELSPNPSRSASPSGGRLSPFLGRGFKASSRNSSRNSSRIPSPITTDGQVKITESITQLNSRFITDKLKASDLKSLTANRPIYQSLDDLRRLDKLNNDDSVFSVNPKSSQKGLLRIVSSAHSSPSQIPRRTSFSGEQLLNRRRSNSVSSSDRKNSIITTNSSQSQSTVVSQPTTNESSLIDLGGYPNAPGTSSRSASRISRPTTLSPIIGTPNKESTDVIDGDQQPDSKNSASTTRDSMTPNNKTKSSKLKSSEILKDSKSSSKIPQKILKSSVPKVPSDKKLESSKTSKASSNSTTISARTSPNLQNSSKNLLSVSSKKPVKPTATTTNNSKKLIERQKSNLQRNDTRSSLNSKSRMNKEPTLKREPSNLKRSTTSMSSRDASTDRKNNSDSNASTIGNNNKDVSNRNSSTAKRDASLAKNNSESNLTKKLVKKNSFKSIRRRSLSESGKDSDENTITDSQIKEKIEKLVPLTKTNVISMTTAAITAQPVHISTAVTNQLQRRSNSSNQLINNNTNSNGDDETTENPEQNNNTNLLDSNGRTTPASIIEKSQKTLENIQKTVAEATEEIQKTLQENLTDLKSLENDMKLNGGGTVIAAIANGNEGLQQTVDAAQNILILSQEKQASHAPIERNESSKTLKSQNSSNKLMEIIESDSENVETITKSEKVATVLGGPSSDKKKTNVEQELKVNESDERVSVRAISALPEVELESGKVTREPEHILEIMDTDKITSENGDSLDNEDRDSTAAESDDQCCCKCSACCNPCCTRLCRPFKCCKKKSKKQQSKTKLKLESEKPIKSTCCGKLNCFKKKSNAATDMPETKSVKGSSLGTVNPSTVTTTSDKRSKCRICIDKFLCCRETNKIESSTGPGDNEERNSLCCCCSRTKSNTNQKPKENQAWQNRRDSLISQPVKKGCCSSLLDKLCCRKKDSNESRRTSVNSKKHSIAPPPEDKSPKLELALVEHSSLMKGAIPVLPVCLAWFCLVCNCIVPGLGTILSGILCLCLGIPRFSQRDSIRGRIGSFVINCIVGVAQAFSLLFCFVGWGWSIWWGTIMLRTAKKRKKIQDAQAMENPDETTSSSNRITSPPVVAQNHRDPEVGVVAGGGGGGGAGNL